MGSITALLNENAGTREEQTEQRERLEMLLSLARARIQALRSRIEAGFSKPAADGQREIRGVRPLRFIEQYHVACSQDLNARVRAHIDAAIDAFFPVSGEGEQKAAIQQGIAALIAAGLGGFTDAIRLGESERQFYIVVPENNAFVRIDIACWKYQLERYRFIGQNDTAIAYVLCKSVIDHRQVTLDELIYLTSEVLSKHKKIASEDYLSRLKDDETKKLEKLIGDINARESARIRANQAAGLPPALSAAESQALHAISPQLAVRFTWVPKVEDVTQGAWRAAAINQTLLEGTYFESAPASMGEVEAYLEELVRVWNKMGVEFAR